MSRSVTVLQLKTRALRRADMVTSGFVQSAEVLDVINDEWPEVFRLLVECGPPDTFSATTAITTIAQTTNYALPADCYQPTTLFANESNNGHRPILPVNDFQLSRLRPPQGVYSLSLEYIPSPAVFVSDADAIDGVAGFDSLLSARVARRLLQKRKADTGELLNEIAQLTAALKTGGRRTKGPRYITDVDDCDGYAWSSSCRISGWRVRGQNIELYEPISGLPT